MPAVVFSHPNPDIGTKAVSVGMDMCSWGYSLNTQTYPTYGGEVVQILSAFVDDIELGGTVETYAEMELIYQYFLKYMQLVTQGFGGNKYDQEPMTLSYPTRGWTWTIHPEQLPGFRYGRDVVAPTWRLTAKVHETDEAIAELTLAQAIAGIERIPMGIGYEIYNPFSDPMGDKKTKKSDLEKYYEKSIDKFNKLIPSYMEGDYDSLLGEVGSKPAFMKGTVDQPGTQQYESATEKESIEGFRRKN